MKTMKISVYVPEGVRIGKVVRFSNRDQGNDQRSYKECKLIAITSNNKFIDEDNIIWAHVFPVPVKKVKPLKDLVQTLLDEGYLPGHYGHWAHEDGSSEEYPDFTLDMFKSVGREPTKNLCYRDSWLIEE